MMVSNRTQLFLLLFCASFLLIACSSKNNENAAKPAPQSTIMMVNGIIVRPGPLENIVRSSGTVLASESVDLVAEAAGRVESISFHEGAHISKNALLVKINDDDLQAQLKKIRLQIELAEGQERRQKQLLEKNGVSQEQYDIALNQVNTLKADRDNVISLIRKREIRAPFDGIIGLRYISIGGYVSPTSRIASIQKINPLKIDFSIPEKYAGQVTIGDNVQLSSEELKLRFTGKLYAVEPKIEQTTRTLQLRAMCENQSEKIVPGCYVQIELRLKTIPDAMMIPTQAIVPVLKGQTVLLQKNGVVAVVPVTTGIRTASTVQITNGLAAGDTVMTTGIMQLRPGMPVKVTISQ